LYIVTQLFVCRENKKNKIPKPLNKKNKQTLQLAKDKRRNNDPQTSYRKLTTLHEMTASTFTEMVLYLYRQQTTAFKIDLSFGFIFRNIETGVLLYYHSSQNNARLFDVPHLIRTEEDLESQCCLRNSLVSGSSGNTSGPTGLSMGVLGGNTVLLCFGLGPDSGAAGLFFFDLWLLVSPLLPSNILTEEVHY
jgi:hypothetical protein